MKKIILRALVCLLVFVLVVVGMCWYLLFRQPERKTPVSQDPTVVDVYGSTFLAAIDEGGTTYAIVTDQAGNRYAAEFNNYQVGSTVAQVNDQIPIDSIPSNYTGPTINSSTTAPVATTQPGLSEPTTQNGSQPTTQGGSQATTQGAEPTIIVPSTDPTQPTVTQAPTQPTAEPTTQVPTNEPYRVNMYQQILEGGNYAMEFISSDADFGDTPVKMAVKGGNMYVKTSIEGLSCTMLYIKREDTMYLLLDDWKKYCELSEELFGEDFDLGSMTSSVNFSDVGDITVSEVEVDGRKLILESYISSADGSTMNYYFEGDVLVRRDCISTAGVIDTMEFTSFTTDVPDSYFEIPQDYSYINLSWLEALM